MVNSKQIGLNSDLKDENYARCVVCHQLRQKDTDVCSTCGSKRVKRFAGLNIYFFLLYIVIFSLIYALGFIHINILLLLPGIVLFSALFSMKYKTFWARKKLMQEK
ncbi:hypothetical protein RJE46_17925 [Cedecea neteri]|uniref:hypothetical protein n=1 Tax=Cedecea neteri TaxID=158822 RepID=UPI00155ED268|nr:hypothetical protein [Cedecea neteri]NIG74719.1 hypothetical protein [Klebsiella sp. Ap-873]WNJ78481.1 hypothetical protein RJE46_17925 [Cedecea neteri]